MSVGGTITGEKIYHGLSVIDLIALDFNTFYPVELANGPSNDIMHFTLSRFYADDTATGNLGSAFLSMQTSAWSWGGIPCYNIVSYAGSTYQSMLGAVTFRGYYVPVLWLRGSYKYKYRSSMLIDIQVYTTATSGFYGPGYDYTIGPISASAMASKGPYLGTNVITTPTVMNDSCNNWY